MATATGKPGTNWKQVTPANRKRIDAIVRHYMKEEHPFDACVRDNRKRFGDRAEKVCAVVKDMGKRTTKWRKGGKGKRLTEAAAPDVLLEAVFDDVLAPALDAAGVTPDELAGWVEDAQAAGLLVEAGLAIDDLTDEQLARAGAEAGERLAMLERLGLKPQGPAPERDLRLVEASQKETRAIARHSRLTSARARRQDAAGATHTRYDEAKHRRGAGGKWITTGSSGREVRAVQRRVGARVDGDFGDKTKAAVQRYQRKHGLKVDGIVGRQTVAALRGRKDAKRVKVGKLHESDRSFLRGHVKREGRKRVVEAVAVERLLDRVKGLEKGEIARLPDGGAVKHFVTEDGREVWASLRPVTWNEQRLASDGETRRTPEQAVRDALTRSAGSDDPDSVGGPERWWSYSTVLVNGQEASFRGVDEFGRPLVRYPDTSGDPVVTTWAALSKKPERVVEAAGGYARKAAAPKWNPDDHPRDLEGQFAKKLGGLKKGEAVELPDGVRVTREGRGFEIRPANGYNPNRIYDGGGDSAKAAATAALKESTSAGPKGKIEAPKGSTNVEQLGRSIAADAIRKGVPIEEEVKRATPLLSAAQREKVRKAAVGANLGKRPAGLSKRKS